MRHTFHATHSFPQGHEETFRTKLWHSWTVYYNFTQIIVFQCKYKSVDSIIVSNLYQSAYSW